MKDIRCGRIIVSFYPPAKKKVVIFDDVGSDIIKRAILEGIDHVILQARLEKIYLSLPVLVLLCRNILLHDVLIFKGAGRQLLRRFLRRLYQAYLLSCVEYIDPAVVITFIDNSLDFQWISRRCKRPLFLAVQNGVRDMISASRWLPRPPEPGSIFSLPHFFCFGEYEKELYKELGHCVDNFYPVGALRGAFYKTRFAPEIEEISYDICLVSEVDYNTVKSNKLAGLVKGFGILNDFLARLVLERGLSLCIASRCADSWERDYFKAFYGDRADIITFNREKMTTYFAMDKSNLILAVFSTAAREAFGWGKKVLFCNFTSDPDFSSPRKGIWSLEEPDYKKFKEMVDYIQQLDLKEYAKKTASCARYLMNYDFKRPAQDVIRGMVLKQLQ